VADRVEVGFEHLPRGGQVARVVGGRGRRLRRGQRKRHEQQQPRPHATALE
jgi:hypothetical protein